MSAKGRLVYSTGPDGHSRSRDACPTCAPHPCRCGGTARLDRSAHALRVRRDRAGRRGKTVTVVSPLYLGREELRDLLGQLKRLCGGGGAAKPATPAGGPRGWALEIQGDHVDRVLERLRELGFPAKRSGG